MRKTFNEGGQYSFMGVWVGLGSGRLGLCKEGILGSVSGSRMAKGSYKGIAWGEVRAAMYLVKVFGG